MYNVSHRLTSYRLIKQPRPVEQNNRYLIVIRSLVFPLLLCFGNGGTLFADKPVVDALHLMYWLPTAA
jgi:hypothetical protein